MGRSCGTGVTALFKKAPKWITCLLWGVVGLRLMLPISFQSPLSLIPSTQTIPQNIAVSRDPAIHTGIPAVDLAVNPVIEELFVPETTPQTTAPTESTGTTPPEATQPETTQPVEPTDETTTPTVMEEHSASEKENSGAWIVWLVVGIVVVADTVIGVIYLKKRKKNQQ